MCERPDLPEEGAPNAWPSAEECEPLKRFLFTVLPSNDLGLLTRSLPIARELRLRGHEVTFCHPAKTPQAAIADAGFENLLPDDPIYFLLHDSPLGLLRRGRPLRTLKAFTGLIRALSGGTAEIWNVDEFNARVLINADITRANVAAIVGIIESSRADAVVDFWNPCACIAARLLKKPLITVIQADQHPQSRGFIWWKNHPSNLATAGPLVNEVLAQYGLPTVRSSGDLFLGDLTMVLGTPELDPLPDTADVTYIGPVLWEKAEAKVPEWIAGLKTGKPVVWVYPGKLRYVANSRTQFDSEVVLQASIKALEKEDVQVVLSGGHHELPRSFLPLPANFRFEPFVPGLAMAARSDLMIHHGGYGSCQTGLYTGTPAVVVPTYSERESNARRVAAQGAGEFVLPSSDASGKRKKVDAGELSAKVRKVLSTPSYKANAERMSARLREYGGAPEAARRIENVVQSVRA